MLVFTKKKKHILHNIHGTLLNIQSASSNYIEYLKTGEILYWKKLVIPLAFIGWCPSKWLDDNAYPDKTEYFVKLCDRYESLCKSMEFDAGNRFKNDDVNLGHISYLKEEFTKMFIEEAIKINWEVPNLREFVIDITGYEKESGESDFPEMFIDRLRKLNLIGRSLEEV